MGMHLIPVPTRNRRRRDEECRSIVSRGGIPCREVISAELNPIAPNRIQAALVFRSIVEFVESAK